MNDAVGRTLCDIIAQYGRGICDDPRRCEGLLKDHCGEHKREIFVLISALKERVAADLMSASESAPVGILLARLERRLCDNLALSEDAAKWAVETLAKALGRAVETTAVVDGQAQMAQEQGKPLLDQKAVDLQEIRALEAEFKAAAEKRRLSKSHDLTEQSILHSQLMAKENVYKADYGIDLRPSFIQRIFTRFGQR